MAFHRFVTPTYSGGLPVGYDLINVVSGGTGASGSAFADSAKGIGNPNTGTYFVAWGEDATSSNANRGLKALSQNTDLLDDQMHRDLAMAVRTNDATAGSPVTTIILPTNTFIGTSGYSTSTTDLARLFSILDTSDNEIVIQGTGQKVQVTSVTLGTGDVVGGGGANGSFSGNTVQINISPSIPTGTSYRIWYGTRTNLATLPADALTTIKIRGAEEVPSEVENLFRLLHGNNLAWNAAWTSTIYDLATSGLYDRYNRSYVAALTAPPEPYFPASNTLGDGSGAWILRSGPALTVYSDGDQSGLVDPLNALFVGKNIDTLPEESGGVVTFAAFGARRSSTANANETANSRTPGGALFMGLWPHDFGASIDATQPYTRIVAGSTASLSNIGSFDPDTGEAIVQLTGASNYFQTAGHSAIAVGYDLIEISYIKSAVTHYHTFVIVGLGASNDLSSITKARVRRLNGTVPDFSATSGATVRWVSTSFAVGDGSGRYHRYANAYADSISVMLDGLYYQVPPSITTQTGDNDVLRVPVRFSAQAATAAARALEWGGFSTSVPSGPSLPSRLTGDGAIYAASSTNTEAGQFYGGVGARGIYAQAGSGGAAAIDGVGTGSNSIGVRGAGAGAGAGGYFSGGATGHGVVANGYGSGAGITAIANDTGIGGVFTGGAFGRGILATGISAAGIEGLVTGGSAAPGVKGTGNITSPGGLFLGGVTGDGVQGTAGASGNGGGGRFTGNGHGAGVFGVGGAGATGAVSENVGGHFTGGAHGHGVYAVGGASSCNGLYALGGGTDAHAIFAQGVGNGYGLYAQGGAIALYAGLFNATGTNTGGVDIVGNGSGHGLRVTHNGAGNGNAIFATRGSVPGTKKPTIKADGHTEAVIELTQLLARKPAIKITEGTIEMNGTDLAITTDPGPNTLHPAFITKGWGLIDCTGSVGSGGASALGGTNILSTSIVEPFGAGNGGFCRVDFVENMLDINYGLQVTPRMTGGKTYAPVIHAQATDHFIVGFAKKLDSNLVGDYLDLAAALISFTFHVDALQ